MDGWPDPTDVEPDPPICHGCEKEVDPELCWCGDPIDKHTIDCGHQAVPLGCECGYGKK